MRQKTEHDGEAAFALLGFVRRILFRLVVLFHMRVPARNGSRCEEAEGDDQQRDRGAGEDQRINETAERIGIAEQPARNGQHGIADHAAEAGRQRPVRGARQTARDRGGSERQCDPADHAPQIAQRTMRDQPPAEHGDRQQQQTRSDAEQLRREIRHDRARRAEQIADRRGGRVTQRGILHRPGRQRDRAEQRERHQDETCALAQTAFEHLAQMIVQIRDGVVSAIDCGHTGLRQPSTATRRCNASAVVSLS